MGLTDPQELLVPLLGTNEVTFSEFGIEVKYERLFLEDGSPTKYFRVKFGEAELGTVTEFYKPVRLEKFLLSMKNVYGSKIKDIRVAPISGGRLRVKLTFDVPLKAHLADDEWPDSIPRKYDPSEHRYDVVYPCMIFFLNYYPGSVSLRMSWAIFRELSGVDIPFGRRLTIKRNEWSLERLRRRMENVRYEMVHEVISLFNKIADPKKKIRCRGFRGLCMELGYPHWIYERFFKPLMYHRRSITFWGLFALMIHVRRYMRNLNQWTYYVEGPGRKSFEFIKNLVEQWEIEKKVIDSLKER